MGKQKTPKQKHVPAAAVPAVVPKAEAPEVDASEAAEAEVMGRLSEQQRRFVELMMGKCAGNVTHAYAEAYIEDDPNAAAAHGSRLVRNGKVRAAIDFREKNDPLVASRNELQRRLSRIARGEERAYYKMIETPEGADRVEMFGSKVADEVRAIELLFKSRGLFVEKHEHSGPGGGPLKVEVKKGLSAETLEAIRREALGLKVKKEAGV